MVFKDKLKQTLWQVPALILMAGIISVGINSQRAEGIALVGDWSAEARFSDTSGQSMVVSLDEAEILFEQDAAVFLDARAPEQFAEGHIRGALNLPWQDFDFYFMELAERLDGALVIIAYCDGQSCELSHDLALYLKEMGYADVRVLVNGWTVWQQADLPANNGE